MVQLLLTHYILRPYFLGPTRTSPICLKKPKCAILSPSLASHFKHSPKVGVYRENFNIGNLGQSFFMVFYICWECAISFSTKFVKRKFSPSTSLSPSSQPIFKVWLKNGKILFWGRKKKYVYFLKNTSSFRYHCMLFKR